MEGDKNPAPDGSLMAVVPPPGKMPRPALVALVAAGLLVVLVALGSLWAFRQIETAAEARGHAYFLISGAKALLSSLKDAETGTRGYLLMGDEIFLEPYLAVRDGMDDQWKVLREATWLDAGRGHLDAMAPLIAAKMALLAQAVEVRRTHDLPTALALLSRGEGKHLMDAIRLETGRYIEIEEGALTRHEAKFRDNMRRLLGIIMGASLLTLLLGLACVWLISRETQARLKHLAQSKDRYFLDLQAQARTDQAETRMDEANARTDEANARSGQAIRATELRYRRLFETAQDGILILDAATGQVVDANPFLKDLLGYSQEEFLGRKLWEIGPFKGEDASKSAFAALQVNDRLHYEGLPLETKDGRRVEVEFISSAYLVDETRLIQCNIRDITERMRVTQALAAANKELAYQVEEKSKRADELAAINEERTLAGVELAYQVEEKSKRADELAAINMERTIANAELAFQVGEKGKRADELAVINEERTVANVELAYQVEEKSKRAEELVVINTELTRSNAELEQFAYVATHDLQEPLRAVASCVQLLQKRYEGQIDARADEFITHAVDGTKRMQTLINDLLAYSRISTHAQEFAATNCEVVLDAAMANLMVAIAESGAAVTADALPVVSGDATQLTQLFQNLLGNALKFRGERLPRIHVGAVCQDGEWKFSVADNGIGMEPQYFERVFLVFQRLHTRKEYQGTGIGLAICKKVVERHGGRIWAESVPGGGATFCFTIPERK
jgi:PAS domain S-box-containing protein